LIEFDHAAVEKERASHTGGVVVELAFVVEGSLIGEFVWAH
jgi:hypothetical protein